VIDDDPAVRQVVMSLGRSVGFEVTGCDGEASLDACLADLADLVILDLVMPVVDGIEVIERLGRLRSMTRLVLVSGQDRRVLASASRLASAHGLKVAAVFSKPFSVADLRSCLEDQKGALVTGNTARLRRVPIDIRTAQIEAALDRHEIVLHYQPQVSVSTLEWVGLEALVRWQHPDYGLLAPDTFVPVVERDAALMQRFTDDIMKLAFDDLVPTGAAGQFQGRISLNMPADVLAETDFPERLVRMATQSGVDHHRIVLEITETTLPSDPVKALAIQTRLRMRGVSLAVDDFGTGHSSLERLHTFPMDELKVDYHFVREATSDPEARAIVHNSIALARDMRVRCVAEGVENLEALRLLRALKCGYAQGFYIGEPMAASELDHWSRDWSLRCEDLRRRLEAGPR
jgi:EAL domain-containing protein (putative c-di-GMP-specific phosphodiesterase class I)